jgi:hypothetical protein
MLISTALLLDSNIRNSVCTPAKLPCRRVVEGNNTIIIMFTIYVAEMDEMLRDSTSGGNVVGTEKVWSLVFSVDLLIVAD